ncbi:MAG: helix-turn-helix domain-containing protein [Oscillospiraceae bacterium]|nr:helix-turn-helix domain-containing protein [Oscillospiraceae bacterium]MCL2278136.1 helix-turn-helix domain-containing protein [Oscillospiraceae bacterium]
MRLSKPTQCDRVLKYMNDFGSISSFEAFSELGVAHLPRRILDLKERGHTIKDEWDKSKNRYGESVSFKRYSLVEVQSE